MRDAKAQYIADQEACDTPDYRFALTRRELAGLGAGTLLTVLRPADAAPALPAARIHAADDGTISVLTGKVDMGQGIRESMRAVVSQELGVDVARVRVVMGDTELCPDDGGTWGSLTTPQTIPLIREAARALRSSVPSAASSRAVRPGVDVVTGARVFPSDLHRPGMRHGRILRPPTYRATPKIEDGQDVIRQGNLLGVVGTSAEEAAAKARAVRVQWQPEPILTRSAFLASIRQKAVAPKPGEGGRYPSLVQQGDVDAALRDAESPYSATFTVAAIAHVPLEPRAAVAEWNGDKLTVWSGCQAPFLARRELAQAFRIPEANVRVIAVDPGGAFGGKQRAECEIEAAALARSAGVPVKLAWSREEEFTASYCRPPGVIDMTVAADERGRLTAWRHRNYNSGAASLAPPYQVEHYSCEFHRCAETPLRQGSYRSLAGVANTFAREATMNELAAKHKADALEFRLRNIADARLRECLERCAEAFGWSNRLHASGVACNIEKDARLALMVEMASPERAARAVMVVDAGAVVHEPSLRAQAEGAIVQGIGGALFEELRHDGRGIVNPHLSSYRVPQFRDAPKIEIIILNRAGIASAGFGEAPITLVAPAIAGALTARDGTQRRNLPLNRN